MDILGQSALLVGVTSFSLGFSILARNVRNKLFLAFAALATLISGWSLAFFMEKVWPGGSFYRLHLFLNIWLGPMALGFIGVLVRIQDHWSRRLLHTSFLLAMCLSAALALHLDSASWVRELIYFAPAAVVLQIFRLMWIDRKLHRGAKRTPKLPTVGLGRRNLIYLGGLLVLSTSVMDHVEWAGIWVPSVGNVALIAYLFFLSQAISQQRLLNFGALFSRFLVLLVVALTLTGVYSLLVGWIQNSPSLFFLNSFIASFIILMLLNPLRTMVGYFTERLMTQKHRRLEETLREAQRKLTGIVDLGSLFQAILQTVDQTLRPDWVALFVLSGDGTKYRRVRNLGQEPQTKVLREILANHPMIQYFQHLRARGELPILLDQILESEIDRSASRTQREQFTALIQGLRALGSNLLIPLIDTGKILGFLSIWAPYPPEPWGSNWGLLSILFPYFEQAAQTMKNMEVFVKQREKERLATLGEMAAGLAHEIRNPLGAIKGAAQYLSLPPSPSVSPDPQVRFLRIIIEEVDRLNRVVTQFLDYSKPPTTDFKLLNLSELVAKTVDVLKPSLKAGDQLVFAPSRVPASAWVSPEQLQQVLVNLIQNSMKAIDGKFNGAGMIQVSVEVEGEGVFREVVVAVEDNGHGIKKENIEKLFIPFFTTSPSGTGLGLSISQKIIEAYRGRIDVQSEEGRFSRFSVILPFAKE